jgi:hypothetical protein
MRRLALLASALLAACSGTPENEPAVITENEVANSLAPRSTAPPAPTPANLASWLPAPGRHAARAMVLAPPPEAVALRDRMAAAIMRNPAWYQGHVASHPEGELPWHANLGISEADYRRYLALTRQIGLRERAQVTLTVTRRPDGGLALGADGAATPLDGIILYPERGRAETPLGGLGTYRATGNEAETSPLGRWRGAEWSNRGTGASRQLGLSAGRRASGELLLYYSYGPSDEETVILLYPAAGQAR